MSGALKKIIYIIRMSSLGGMTSVNIEKGCHPLEG